MEKSFRGLAELHAEKTILIIRKEELEDSIKEKFDGPMATVKSMWSLFKSGPGKKSFLEQILNNDSVTNIARLVFPILLNGSLFKKSGFLTKAIVTMLSQKAAKKVNFETITNLFDKLKELLKKKEHEIKPAIAEYGIPPDSETY